MMGEKPAVKQMVFELLILIFKNYRNSRDSTKWS